ncbi:MAG: inositol monophosphatase [Nocardioides sp.]|nr:inositol monophosphatase [Nocardioides sp.]
MNKTVVNEMLSVAVETAIEAGGLLMGSAFGTVAEKSSANDLVTDMDIASEALICERLLTSRPLDGVLGEECGEHVGSSTVRWVIDPLDGTGNYLRGFPAFAVSIAAEVAGKPLLGVVHDPSRGETFTAVSGRGARCGTRLLSIAQTCDLQRALVASGYGPHPASRLRQAAELAGLLEHVGEVRQSGSAALDLCWVAAGRIDVYFERDTRIWDRAAGLLIAQEAGAMVCGPELAPPSDDLVVAGPSTLVRSLLQLLDEGTS